MTIQAQLADGRVLEFPDGTDPKVIQATVKRMLEPSMGEKLMAGAEAGFKALVADPLSEVGSGLTGAALAPAVGMEGAADIVENYPKYEASPLAMEYLQNIGESELMQLAAKGYDALKGYGRQVGQGYQDMASFAGASPETSAAIGTGAETLITGAPDILSAAAGMKGAQSLTKPKAGTIAKPSKGDVRAAVVEAAPSVDELKAKSRELYKSIDDSGAKINEDSYLDLVVNIREKAKAEGHRAKLNPKSEIVLRELEGEIDLPHKVSDIDSLRKVAQQAAGSADPADARMGSIIIDEIDDYLDNLKPADIRGDIDPSKVGQTYQKARELWRRNKKVNLLEDADIRADLAASGYENGLRQEFTRILKDKKKRRAFNAKELREMEAIAKGTKGSNAAKFLGKFGLSEGRATSMVGSSIAAAGGTAATGSPIGGAAALGIGQFSKGLAQRLTRNNARFADAVVRAGDNAEEIAKAYLRNTPKAKRSPTELKELFLERKITPDKLVELQGSTDKVIAASALAAELALRKQSEQDNATN